MNPHQPMPQVQPAVPFPSGRPRQTGPYTPSPHPPQQAPYYPYQYPIHYQRPPPQWAPYPMPMPMQRGYQPYPPTTPYPIPQHIPPMRPSPHQAPSSSSIRSVQGVLSPTSSNTSLHPTSSTPAGASNPHLAPPTPPPPPVDAPSAHRLPYYPPLPWQSFDGTFPTRAPRRRRKKVPVPQSASVPVELPSRRGSMPEEEVAADAIAASAIIVPLPTQELLQEHPILETPSTSHPPSEGLSTQPTTPSSAVTPQQATPKIDTSGRPIVPILPIVPAIPNFPLISQPSKRASTGAGSDVLSGAIPSNADHLTDAVDAAAQLNGVADLATSVEKAASPLVKAAPKSWADLVRDMGPPSTSAKAPVANDAAAQTNASSMTNTDSLAHTLTSYSVKDNSESAKVAFLEPRGLVNTGNMCYMNSILQILVFCLPFYNFLDQVGKQAAHSVKSGTPLMDAMIMFLREYLVIDAAVSVDQLRLRLKDNELEQYGEAFIPEFVYEIIRRLPRFSSMRRGHQQDAEEFLGFVLEEMHEECTRAMRSASNIPSFGASAPSKGVASPLSESNDPHALEDGGWLEVGPKQRAAVTRSSGAIATESPVTKIFGGKLRSEFRVPGMKNSVTLEPYQPLQLDIGAANVSNIIDALKGLTKPESIHGDFYSPRGPNPTATKQVFIETLPQVLILHLKRFQYDSSGGTQKIWKKIGYPLDLEIPKEVFPQHKRGGLLAQGGLPKYRLIGVVYHHGKNAGGGHYTVDVRRQEGREWIRIDDTVIRRVRSEDVVEGGSEEDPKVLAAALEQHKLDEHHGNNVYEQFTAEENAHKESSIGWSQVNGLAATHSTGGKKWSGVANGNVTPTQSSGKMTLVGRASVKDNKVAYILFYQRVNA